MFTIIGYVIVGLIGGSIAKKFVPGSQSKGWLSTVFLGIGGAVVGGLLGDWFLNFSYSRIFSIRGLIFSILGATLLLGIQNFISRRK